MLKKLLWPAWVENENNQLIIRGPVWLAKNQCANQLDRKITIKFHTDKKSPCNYMRTQKETFCELAPKE